MPLVFVLERSDGAGFAGVGLAEMMEGGSGGRAVRAAGWRTGAGKMAAQVLPVAQPTPEPPVGGGDGERQAASVPDPVERPPAADSGNQSEKVGRGDGGVVDEMAPEDGERAPASPVAAAVRAKKRSLLTSRSWLWDRYPPE